MSPLAGRLPVALLLVWSSLLASLGSVGATPSPLRASAASETVALYLVALDDQGRSGPRIGCGDSLVPVHVPIPAAASVAERVAATLGRLLAIRSPVYGQTGLYNALYRSTLAVERVIVDGGTATVLLTGRLAIGGVCDEPRVEEQLRATIRQFPGINEAVIVLNRGPFPPGRMRYVPETGFVVQDRFLAYWDRFGGLPVFGYPISPERQEDGRTVQSFERARFEYQPGTGAERYDVLLGRLGVTVAARRGLLATPPFQPAQPPAGCRFFVQTRHSLCAGFRAAWERFGGLPIYGYPISEEFADPVGGRTVQYFERARFEWHPGVWPQRFDVLLGRLGVEALVPAIEVPAAGARVTLPLHILARVGVPGQTVAARLRWQDGSERSVTMPVLRGEDGGGLVIGTPPWWPDEPPQPGTQPATLHLRTGDGTVLAEQAITVLAPDDPATQVIQLYWTVAGTEQVQPEPRRIVRTVRVGTAALEELLWGPPPVSSIGYRTALPTPEEVLRFPGREPAWGPRVRLRSLRIEDGVATADFTPELGAYGGGSLRVRLIREQITRTLRQFPTVRAVRIAVEGQTEGVLEP